MEDDHFHWKIKNWRNAWLEQTDSQFRKENVCEESKYAHSEIIYKSGNVADLNEKSVVIERYFLKGTAFQVRLNI